jgi:hypothetical protein
MNPNSHWFTAFLILALCFMAIFMKPDYKNTHTLEPATTKVDK